MVISCSKFDPCELGDPIVVLRLLVDEVLGEIGYDEK